MCGYHLEEHGGRDGHPVQLDLKGGVEGEVSVVVAAAPLSAVAAVVDVHVQGDRLLLRDGGSCRGKSKNERKENKKWREQRCKRRSRGMKDDWHQDAGAQSL